MKRVLLLAVILTAGPVFAATYNWSNANANNDFGDYGNWTEGPTTFTANDLQINLSGADKAEISSTLSSSADELRLGYASGATGELLISGGINSLTNTLRVGRLGGTGILTITGGTFSVPVSYTTFADGGTAIINMSGGTLNADRITWGQGAADTCTLNMTGGTINISQTDTTPASSSGGFKTGLGNSNLYISETAEVNAEKFMIAAGGLVTMTGGTIHISGAADPLQTFDFSEATLGTMVGKLLFNGGIFSVDGNYEALLDAAVGSGNFYTTLSGMSVDAQYFSGEDVTRLMLVPEPLTMALLGLGGLMIRRRK